MIKAKPFIKWVGGKTQLIRSTEKALPENFADKDFYPNP
jgi:DNA adenine methylase